MLFETADSCLKQLERDGGDAPPGMVELSLTSELDQMTVLEGFDVLGYRVVGDARCRDIVDIHTGEVAADDIHVFDAVDAMKLAECERGRARCLVEALEVIAAAYNNRGLARQALDQYEAEVGSA